MTRRGALPVSLLIASIVLLAVSAIRPHDYLTWALEVAPIFIGYPLLVLTYRRFQFTPLVYIGIFVHGCILMVGAHYTYELVPLGEWMKPVFGFTRNNYDRIGHIAQGFVPALIAREILLRRTPLRPGKMLFFLVTCVCLAISAFYEFIEWWVALAAGHSSDAFLGTQGDPWDTHWDMFMAFLAAMAAQVLLSWLQERQIVRLTEKPSPSKKPEYSELVRVK